MNLFLYGLSGQLVSNVSAVSTLLPVTSALSGAIVAAGFVNGTDTASFSISAGGTFELVEVTAVSGTILTITRGANPVAFPAGSTVAFEVTAQAIIDTIGTVAATTVTGTNAATVTPTGANSYNVDVLPVSVVGEGQIAVLGAWPSYRVTFTGTDAGCCGEGAASGAAVGGITDLVGTGIANAFVDAGIGTVNVTAPTFTAGANVTITGAWPTYTIAATSGSGSVTSVAVGAGLTLTGNPAVNPSVAIANTGVTAGTYGGVAVNARGQLTTVPPGWNPVSTVAVQPGLSVVRVAETVTLAVDTAAVGVPGIAPLADSTDPFDPLDTTSIATPAIVALAMSTALRTETDGHSSYIGESDGDYTNLISGSATAVQLDAGESAIVYAEVSMRDGVTPTNVVSYGLGVFNASPAKVSSNRIVPQCTQNMSFMLLGPLNTTLSLATTAVPTNASVVSYSLWVIRV